MSRDFPLFFVQAAEQAEALYYPASLHDLIVFTLELPLIECIQDEKGSVLLCCPGCKKLHVLSDHLGYFDDATVDAAKILEERGETVRRLSNSDALLELLTEDDLKVFRSATKGVSLKDGSEKAVVNMSDSRK
jgi:hypothetical protein